MASPPSSQMFRAMHGSGEPFEFIWQAAPRRAQPLKRQLYGGIAPASHPAASRTTSIRYYWEAIIKKQILSS